MPASVRELFAGRGVATATAASGRFGEQDQD
jgi:hypothetical protein